MIAKDMNDGPLHTDPFAWFGEWLSEAEATGMVDPNACAVATVDSDGRPSARIVLLKEWDERGFVFYTNLTSRKGREALGQEVAAMTFFWRDMDRQIRIEGDVVQVSDEQADAYYATRPKGSRVGAWASNQSSPLDSRQTLMEEVAGLEAKYADTDDVPRPPHWSGLRIVPRAIEFWQAGAFRLHNRFVFTRAKERESWEVQRLNP
ncbi:MAG: pyridoxamine 5'-phosphate oxidase [Myxococcota bacterium]